MNQHRMLESLERRSLLSAAIEAGVLTITGTEASDEIKIELKNDGATILVKIESDVENEVDDDEVDDDEVDDNESDDNEGEDGESDENESDDDEDESNNENDDAGEMEFEFNFADVTSIKIDALGGDDEIKIEDEVSLPSTINAGAGDDEVESGSGDDYI
ncbi:MAG TPA: hypothetical protein PK402_06000, partial [Tepidisphaeraceae bacterium]|nr:hypothetical protein [Tepidisphaeraceae bacterium]